MPELLFVYGSLKKRGGLRHALLDGQAEHVCAGRMPGKLYAVADYPGAVYRRCKPQLYVQGEIYRLYQPLKLMSLLDVYEECCPEFPAPWEYRREKKPIEQADGSRLIAWVYLYNRRVTGLKQIMSGIYNQADV